MIKSIALIAGLAMVASPALSNSINSGSDSMSASTNSLTIEGSRSSSVGVGNNTAPCQQVNGMAILGSGFSKSTTLDWCKDMEMVKFLTKVVKLKGVERQVAMQTLCRKKGDFRDILVATGHCVVVKK